MNKDIIEIKQDIAGKWYARVVLDKNTTYYFKYEEEPREKDILKLRDDVLIKKTVDRKAKRIERIDQTMLKLQEERAKLNVDIN